MDCLFNLAALNQFNSPLVWPQLFSVASTSTAAPIDTIFPFSIASSSNRMILKDLETVDKSLKKEPDETPPSSVDTTPLQVHIPQSQPNRIPTGPTSYTSPLSGNLVGANLSHTLQINGELSGIPSSLEFASALAAAANSSHQNVSVSAAVSAAQNAVGSSLAIPMSVDGHILKPIAGIDSSFSEWPPSMMTAYSSSPSPTMIGSSRTGVGEDENNRKRQVRLQKNREAAKECRRKKKEYVKCLENRVAVLENQNKALIEELKTLKELYCRKEKSDM